MSLRAKEVANRRGSTSGAVAPLQGQAAALPTPPAAATATAALSEQPRALWPPSMPLSNSESEEEEEEEGEEEEGSAAWSGGAGSWDASDPTVKLALELGLDLRQLRVLGGSGVRSGSPAADKFWVGGMGTAVHLACLLTCSLSLRVPHPLPALSPRFTQLSRLCALL